MRRYERDQRSLLEILTGKKKPEIENPISVSGDGRVKRYFVDGSRRLNGASRVLTTIETDKGAVAVLETDFYGVRSPNSMGVAGKNGRLRFFGFRIETPRPGDPDYSLTTFSGETKRRPVNCYAGSGHAIADKLATGLLGNHELDHARGAEEQVRKVFDLQPVKRRTK
jgi:hypothetical protein